MRPRIIGCLEHAPHASPHGPGIGVTIQIALLPSQRSAVGTPFVI